MKILAIISRDLEKGSTKYRLAQYADYLFRHGVEIDFVRRDKINNSMKFVRHYDILFNQKCLISPLIGKKILATGVKVVFDFDDAIYTRPGKPFSWLTKLKVKRRFRFWLENATTVITPNIRLSNVAKKYSNNVKIVPMALDLIKWRPPLKNCEKKKITIGWAGAPVNLHLIEELDSVLTEITSQHQNVLVAIFSGKKPKLKAPFIYYAFESGAEPDFVRRLDIGLLPLVDEEFAWGKSPIKSLQYLSCGVPVVGNVVGAAEEILTPDNSICVKNYKQWIDALNYLIANPKRVFEMGVSGRSMVEKKHDIRQIAPELLDLLQSC